MKRAYQIDLDDPGEGAEIMRAYLAAGTEDAS